MVEPLAIKEAGYGRVREIEWERLGKTVEHGWGQ